MQTSTRSYRCTYTPKDSYGHLVATDNGVLPFVQVQAAGAEQAIVAAYALTGCPISEAQRIEEVAA